jgi:hypothetical protein
MAPRILKPLHCRENILADFTLKRKHFDHSAEENIWAEKEGITSVGKVA